jgi:hypothetical protein
MEYEPAELFVTIPEDAKKWSAEEAQEWARNMLAGGPPDVPIKVATRQPIKWSDIKKCIGEKIRLVAKPKGLIFKFDDGSRKYIAGDTSSSSKSSGRILSKINTASMQIKSREELKIRTFVQEEIERYNKKIREKIVKEKETATFEFWDSGKRIRSFLNDNPDISLERITLALEQWGRGKHGYGKRTFEYTLFFFDWKPDLKPGDPIFKLSETRIMNIIIATKEPEKRDHLVLASLEGPLANVKDSQFKWITGQVRDVPPERKPLLEKIRRYGNEIMETGDLSNEKQDDLLQSLKGL